jgi:hypothetical protein
MTTSTLERPTEVVTHEQSVTTNGKWIGFAVILSAMILNILDSTILNVAAPSIQRDHTLSASRWPSRSGCWPAAGWATPSVASGC